MGQAWQPPSTPHPARPHLQEEADLVHAPILGDEALQEQAERLHGPLVQHLGGDSSWAWPAALRPAPCGQHPHSSLTRSLGICPGDGHGHSSLQHPGWLTMTSTPGPAPVGEGRLLGHVSVPPLQRPQSPCGPRPLFALSASIPHDLVPFFPLRPLGSPWEHFLQVFQTLRTLAQSHAQTCGPMLAVVVADGRPTQLWARGATRRPLNECAR